MTDPEKEDLSDKALSGGETTIFDATSHAFSTPPDVDSNELPIVLGFVVFLKLLLVNLQGLIGDSLNVGLPAHHRLVLS